MCTVECIKQKDGDTWPAVTFGLHRVVLEVDEDNEEVTSRRPSKVHLGRAGNHRSGEQRRAPVRTVRLLQAIGTGAPEKEVRQRFYELMDDADSDAKKNGMATSRRQGRIAGPDYPSRGLV